VLAQLEDEDSDIDMTSKVNPEFIDFPDVKKRNLFLRRRGI